MNAKTIIMQFPNRCPMHTVESVIFCTESRIGVIYERTIPKNQNFAYQFIIIFYRFLLLLRLLYYHNTVSPFSYERMCVLFYVHMKNYIICAVSPCVHISRVYSVKYTFRCETPIISYRNLLVVLLWHALHRFPIFVRIVSKYLDLSLQNLYYSP